MMKIVAQRINECEACPLHISRTNVVVGEGSLDTPLMFIGEGPGEEEDKTGRPFVGRAGQLLTKILESVNIDRNEVYITNIVKCRPPKNRTPTSAERKACFHFLMAQIEIINPKIIVALGGPALNTLLNANYSITKMRGTLIDWKGGIKIFPMFHPSFLLRNPSKAPGSPKFLTWEDVKKLKEMFDKFKG